MPVDSRSTADNVVRSASCNPYTWSVPLSEVRFRWDSAFRRVQMARIQSQIQEDARVQSQLRSLRQPQMQSESPIQSPTESKQDLRGIPLSACIVFANVKLQSVGSDPHETVYKLTPTVEQSSHESHLKEFREKAKAANGDCDNEAFPERVLLLQTAVQESSGRTGLLVVTRDPAFYQDTGAPIAAWLGTAEGIRRGREDALEIVDKYLPAGEPGAFTGSIFRYHLLPSCKQPGCRQICGDSAKGTQIHNVGGATHLVDRLSGKDEWIDLDIRNGTWERDGVIVKTIEDFLIHSQWKCKDCATQSGVSSGDPAPYSPAGSLYQYPYSALHS